jgi:hypothetical protein
LDGLLKEENTTINNLKFALKKQLEEFNSEDEY